MVKLKNFLSELRIVSKALETYEGLEESFASLKTQRDLGEKINKALSFSH